MSAFKNLSKKDTLTVNIKNVGCHVANGEYLLFYRIDTNYTMLQFLDFHNAIYLDGKRLNDLEKQKFLLESQKYDVSNKHYTITKISKSYFNQFIDNLLPIIESNNETVAKIAGDDSFLTLKLNDFYFHKEVSGWIELPDISESGFSE